MYYSKEYEDTQYLRDALAPYAVLPPFLRGGIERLAGAMKEQQAKQEHDAQLMHYWKQGSNYGGVTAHEMGYDAAAGKNYNRGLNAGFVKGAKQALTGDRYMIMDYDNQSNPITGSSIDKLVDKIPDTSPLAAFIPTEKGGPFYTAAELYGGKPTDHLLVMNRDNNTTGLFIDFDIAREVSSGTAKRKTPGVKGYQLLIENGNASKPMRRVTDVDSLLSVIQPAGGVGPAAYKPPSDMKKLRKTWTKDAYIEWTKQGQPLDKGTSLPRTNAKGKGGSSGPSTPTKPFTPTKRGRRRK